MTIRKKLLLSHLCMIFIPILLAAAAGIGLFHVYGSRYWDSAEEMLGDLNRSDLVEWTVYECAAQYSFADWDEEEEAEDSVSRYSSGDETIWEYLSWQLADMGYQSEITVDGTVASSNLTQSDEEYLAQYFSNDSAKMKHRTVNKGRVTIVKSSYDEGDETISVIAVSHTAWRTTLYVALYLLFVVVSIILTNVLLLNWLGKSILLPLGELQRGTRRISEGDLDSMIAYAKPDEFGEVCQDFDRMRLHLKESVETQARQESDRQEMLSGISHDLRTPLTSIKGYAEGLQEGIANTEEKRRRYCRAIHTCALEMEGLLDSLSTFSRLENKSYQYKLEMTDLDEYLSRLTESHKENLSQWGAALFYENRADRTRGKIDRQEMQRVFANLFENSVKYRTKGSCTIHVTMENRGNDLLIRVADDGPGVPEQELENIFHIFYRGDASRAKTENGSGLGLAIVRRIVEGHNGTIKACNDGGLVMEITLPLA